LVGHEPYRSHTNIQPTPLFYAQRSTLAIIIDLSPGSLDAIVIFKEKGIHFPTNFQNIGYIEFESNDIQARTADLLKELIGFGLVWVTPT
jgi:hypothetical protein